MSDKATAPNFEKKEKMGILRKRDTPSIVSNNSITQRITAYRAKSKADSNPQTARSVDEGGLFSKRSKIPRSKPSTAPATAPVTPRVNKRGVISACPSTTTLDSRFTATSQSSFSHKPGFIPAFYRNKTGTKYFLAAQMQSYKKQFNQIKKDLVDLQNKAVEYYKRYRESLLKLNKLNGKDDPPTIEELQIIDFKENTVNPSTDVSIKSTVCNCSTTLPQQSPPTTDKQVAANFSFTKLKQITDEKILSDISRQVHGIQVQSFKLLQEFSDRLALINSQMKLVDKSESGDTNLFPAKIQCLFEEIETKILEEEEHQSSRISNFMANLKHIMINDEGTPVLMKDGLYGEFEKYRKTNERKIMELEMKIKDMELKTIHDEYKIAELMRTIANEKANITELNAALNETQSKRDDRGKEFEQMMMKLKTVELAHKRLEKQFEDKTLEVIAKEKAIVELKTSIKAMQDKVLKSCNQVQKLESKVGRANEECKIEMNELKAKNASEVETNNALRSQISELNKAMGDDFKQVREENIKLKHSEKMLMKEIDNLKQSFNELLHSKMTNERSKSDEGIIRRELDRRDEEIIRLKAIIMEMKEELIKREIIVVQKNREITDMECLIKQLEKRDIVMEFQVEIQRLKELNAQQSNEIEQLQADLNKSETALRLQEESLFMQKRLLKIRSELIHSLEENENSTKHQISDLNLEVERRARAVKQLNLEVSSKTEELGNLFSTLGAKNLEVRRQDHIIKLLEETHERNQKVRVKLEGKIAHLENENAELKRVIKYRT